MIRSLHFLVVVCSCAGCVSSQNSYLKDGRQGHIINCTPGWTGGIVGAVAQANTSWGTCYQKAGEICGIRGYDVLEKVGEEGSRADVGQYGGTASTTNNRTLVVRCKGDK